MNLKVASKKLRQICLFHTTYGGEVGLIFGMLIGLHIWWRAYKLLPHELLRKLYSYSFKNIFKNNIYFVNFYQITLWFPRTLKCYISITVHFHCLVFILFLHTFSTSIFPCKYFPIVTWCNMSNISHVTPIYFEKWPDSVLWSFEHGLWSETSTF